MKIICNEKLIEKQTYWLNIYQEQKKALENIEENKRRMEDAIIKTANELNKLGYSIEVQP